MLCPEMPHPAPEQILSQEDRGSCSGPNTDAFMPASNPLGNFRFRPTCPFGLIRAKEQNLMVVAVWGGQTVITTCGSELGVWLVGDDKWQEATNTCAFEQKQAMKWESKENASYLWKSTSPSIPFATQVTLEPFYGINGELQFKFQR